MQRLEVQIKPSEGQAVPGSVSPLHSHSRRSGEARQTDPRSAGGGRNVLTSRGVKRSVLLLLNSERQREPVVQKAR